MPQPLRSPGAGMPPSALVPLAVPTPMAPEPDVVEAPAAGLPPDASLLTPPDVGDDLVVLYVYEREPAEAATEHAATTARYAAAHIAHAVRARVILSEFRRPPRRTPSRDPRPSACLAAYAYAALLVPGARVVVAGDVAAGDDMVAAILVRGAEEGLPAPLAAILYGGVFDAHGDHPAGACRVPRPDGRWDPCGDQRDAACGDAVGPVAREPGAWDDAYLDPPELPRTYSAFASMPVERLAQLPPLFIQVSGPERLADGSRLLAAHTARGGVRVETEVAPGAPHARRAAEAVSRTAAFLGSVTAAHTRRT
ncbi:alpha/beta hydrolase [Yinghuangia sp. ASG 101]|uniref:alpha/beta hydrolase fold domain-containing protein n=1 Tax=Yinghuangia sp. ASG 101 TaxID=2896848 RepID=UPI001E4EA739|nr:alpha/beta hydrolase fold domain-containing protein [Yinghuangia sp. ASG 101]UGQ13228.1 alpha/beta hydrolase [Yinghuangia sp. ASG 101]